MKGSGHNLTFKMTLLVAVAVACVQLIGFLLNYRHLNLTIVLVEMATGGLLVLVIYLWMRLFVFQPLERLVRVMQQAAQGSPLQRLAVERDDEIGKLMAACNGIQARLTEMEASQIDSDVELGIAHWELELKAELERQKAITEKANRELRQQVEQLQLLYDLASELVAALEVEHIVEVLERRVASGLGGEGFLLLLAKDGGKELHVAASHGALEMTDAVRPGDLTNSLITAPLRRRRLHHVPDLSRQPVDAANFRVVPAQGSFLGAPLLHKDTVLGCICLWRPGHEAFSPSEEKLLASVAHLTSLSLANAHLYQEKLDLSVTDELTGLANRRLLGPRLELEWNRAKRFESPLSLLMIDIDFFKQYNDRNGHLLGDRVLQEVARLLKANTRRVDTVARFGGEEFVIVLPGQSRHTAFDIAEKLRQTVAEAPFYREETQRGGKLTISVGLATFPDDAEDPHSLLEAADLALYASKLGGRNRTTRFHPEMKKMAEERLRQKQEKRKRRRRKKFHPRRLELIDPT